MEKPTHAALFTGLGTQVTERVEIVDGCASWAVTVGPDELPKEVAQIGLWFEGDTWPRPGLLPELELYSYSGRYEMSGLDRYTLNA